MRKALLLTLLLLPSVAFALPDQIIQEGVVMDAAGAPMEGEHDIRVRLYDAEDSVLPFYDERHPDVEFQDGYYAIVIGGLDPITAEDLMRESIFVGITIDQLPEMTPRTPLRKVPAAFTAEIAFAVRGDISPASVAIDGVGVVINDEGEWVGSAIGLRGPAGPRGVEGPIGPVGPPGDVIMVEGLDGFEDLPERVIDLLGQDENPPFLRRDQDETTTGNLTLSGSALRLSASEDGESRNGISLGNNNVVGVNGITFADPGVGEGLSWAGSDAKIFVAPNQGGNEDGPIQLSNADNGVNIVGPTSILGSLEVTGTVRSFNQIRGTTLLADSGTLRNLNLASLNAPNDRLMVETELELQRNVILSEGTAFVGTVRAGGLSIAGPANFNGDISATNVRAQATVLAGGNVETGFGGLMRAGSGGIFVRDRRVFDGNGNLLAKPSYDCPAGQLMFGTDANGNANCVRIACEAGRYFRGVDNEMSPICGVPETGLTQLPAIECPEGQAVIQMNANGRVVCGSPRSGNQFCPEGEFVTGVDPDGTLICDSIPDPNAEDSELRPNLTVCGELQVNLRNILNQSEVNLEIIESCDPTDQSQAFIVARNGEGRYDAGLLRSYVRSGGIVISEFGNSHIVFNDIFETAVERGERFGNCGDNINPAVRLSTRNRFWRDNRNVAEHDGLTNCGYAIDEYPDVIKLGGWEQERTFFGYRDLGLGRMWIIEADWADGSETWTEQSARLLAYTFINGRRDGDLFEFEGVRENVADARLIGWYKCYGSRYADRNLSIADMKQRCNGDKVMYGCRPVGAANWTVLGQGLRNEIFTKTGDGNNRVTRSNGIDWYYSDDWSMGMAAAGTGVSRNRCDVRGEPQRNQRICWHTENGRMMAGFRCGARTGLNEATDWERAVFTNRLTAGGGDVYFSCKEALENGQDQSGVYDIMPPGAAESGRVYCDMNTDDGGWTLVASSRNGTVNDEQADYYEDLASLSPGSVHRGIWGELSGFDGNFDVRFACRDSIGAATDDMTVDLSFYNVEWYREWVAGADGDSCFEEDNGQGATRPSPSRRNNLTEELLEEANRFGAGFMEGEDTCDSEDDFTVDFDDRGMGGNANDGTDWGEADNCQKCGDSGCLDSGQWFIFAREREAVQPPLDITAFPGILKDIPDTDLDNWCLCHSSRYAQRDQEIPEILIDCDGPSLMFGCRPSADPNWTVLAMGDREAVFTDTGDGNNETHEHNGVAWYFSENQSMGFSPIGVPVRRASCDTDTTQGDKKLCWHTEENSITAGWRCGSNRGLNAGLNWERAIWTRGAGSTCIPPDRCEGDADCPGGRSCQNTRCLPPPPECLVDRDCGEDRACELGRCVDVLPDCAEDTDCPEQGQICFDAACVHVAPPPECLRQEDCAQGTLCCTPRCVEFRVGDDPAEVCERAAEEDD